MSKLHSPHLYPNPFRYGKLKTKLDQTNILDEINQNLKPFLNDKFFLVQEYLDEFGNLKSERKIIRILSDKIKSTLENLKTKLVLIEQSNLLNSYNKNLRYLELPVQPFTDKRGIEVQFLSNEILEDAIEEIDEGFSYIYDYCSEIFPESTELWTEYALLSPKEFPFISHDSILESTYEIFDKIFDNLQKNSVNVFSWVISGDLNNRLLKVIKPNITQTKLNYFFIILESTFSITLLLLLVRYVITNSTSQTVLKNKTIDFKNLHGFFCEIKKNLNLRRFRIKQKSNKFKEKVINLKTKFKYKVIKIVLS